MVNDLNPDDFISSLPDDVLLIILSKLSTIDQARTSILSSRWANLWASNTCLTIDTEELAKDSKTMTIRKFMNTVDQILRMRRGQAINHLKITYPSELTNICGDRLKGDSWIDIAKRKQVKALYLNFDNYPVPLIPLVSSTFSSLVTLSLKEAYLSGEIIHGLLTHSLNLLELSIIHSFGCKHLSISGSSLKLKHLELIHNSIDSLEIFAPNLVSFRFDAQSSPERIRISNMPLLTQLSCSLGFILRAWHDFYVLLPQLVTFTLVLIWKETVAGDVPNFPVLVNLKQAKVRLLTDGGDDRLLHFLAGLFRASPYLCRLSLFFEGYILQPKFIKYFPSHKFIKELEIDNCKGFEHEVQLLICIVEFCSSLQKIIISHPWTLKRFVEQEAVESVVKKLAAISPQKELKIVF